MARGLAKRRPARLNICANIPLVKRTALQRKHFNAGVGVCRPERPGSIAGGGGSAGEEATAWLDSRRNPHGVASEHQLSEPELTTNGLVAMFVC